MPHRSTAGDNRLDARLESSLGRLHLGGYISEPEFDAGIRYGRIALLYLQSIDAPEPYGDGDNLRSLTDDECFKRKLIYSQARQILRSAGKRCQIAVDRIAIYGEMPRDPREWYAMRDGLKALAGNSEVKGFNIIPLFPNRVSKWQSTSSQATGVCSTES